MEPEHYDILVDSGQVIQVMYTITLGDLIVSSMIALLLLALILISVIRMVWRR